MMDFYNIFNLLPLMFFMLILLIPSHLFKCHPLMFSLMLLIYTMVLVIKLNIFFNNYWYSYMLFLIMIGGILILFLYLTSISNNEFFLLDLKYFIYFSLKILIFMAMIMWLFYFFFNINFLESGEIMKINYFLVNENYLFKNLYMNNLMYLNLFMIFYLLLMMIISVLICLKLNIPLRQYCI